MDELTYLQFFIEFQSWQTSFYLIEFMAPKLL